MAVPARLCPRCHDALSRTFTSGHHYEDRQSISHHQSFSALHDAARGGCPICSWLMSRNRRNVHPTICDGAASASLRATFLARRWVRGVYGQVPVLERDAEDGEHSYQAQFEVDAGESLKAPGLRVYLEPSDGHDPEEPLQLEANTGSDCALAVAKSWLRDCDEKHDCWAGFEAFHPTRLLHLTRGPDGKIKARLVASDVGGAFTQAVQYTTVSHRWLGSDQETQLTKEVLQEFYDDVPLASLKPSILDAMHVTLQLGLSYMWVDSLCIISDDEGDRNKEIGAMWRIYGKSYCTIAAASAETTDQGCFWQRDPEAITKYVVELDLQGMAPSAPKQHYLRLYWGHGSSKLRNCQLTKRAWVFQERFLSPRIIYFCEDQLHWECWDLVASETYPEGRPPLPGEVDYHHKTAFKPSNRDHEPDVDHILESWNKNVETYAKLDLTFPEDRLRALAGVAGYCQPLLKDSYLSGHWRNTLPVSLLWSIAPKYTSPRRRLYQVAPSWSWASISGPVRMGEPDIVRFRKGAQVLAEVVNANTTESRSSNEELDNTFVSDLAEPHLRLRARPWDAKIYGNQTPDAYTLLAAAKYKFKLDKIFLDLPLVVPRDVTCLPILSHDRGGERQRISGLILVRQGDGQDGVYERVGIYSVYVREPSAFQADEQREVLIA